MFLTLGYLHKAVVDRMEADAEAIARRMMVGVREEVEEYRAIRDPALGAQVLAHGLAHVHAFVRAVRNGPRRRQAPSSTSCASAARSGRAS